MTGSTPWLLLSIGGLLILLLVIVLIWKRKKNLPPDYYSLFIMGIIWLPIGIALGSIAFIAMGLVFTIVGFLNRDQWEKNRRGWNKMSKDERKLFKILVISLLILLVIGIIIFLLKTRGII